MYERFFDLRERPFALSPDPDYLYPSRVHREALGYLRYGIESQAGFVVITGEIGCGKTTLLQALLRGLDGQTTVIRLMNTLLEPRELLEAIAIDLGFEPSSASKPALLRELATRLVDERAAGRLVLLVIDEAQNLGLPALEEIRMLSNLETEKSKLLQIVLVGQPDLRDKLNLPALEQLRQRITVSYHLAALDAAETEAYVNHRLRRASLGAPLQFPREVTDRVHERSRGVPRLINVICDAALVFAYAEERRAIDRPLVDEALGELEATGVLRPPAGETAPVEPTPRPAPETVDAYRPAMAVAQEALPAPVAHLDAEVGRAQEIVEKEATLRVKEQQLARREEQLTEQRRVLAEEYRLFRARPVPGPAPSAFDVRGGAPPWPPAPADRQPQAAPGAPEGLRHDVEGVRRDAEGDRWSGGRPGGRQADAAARPRPIQAPPRTSTSFRAQRWAEPAPPRRTFWRRVKHLLLGFSEPVMEDRQ
jgi:putative secretion ATPase (PEP-CTERM system associated)